MAHVAKLTSKSQITIPAAVRRQLGLAPGDRVILEIEEGRAILRPARGTFTERMVGLGAELWASQGGGSAWLEAEREGWGAP